MASVRTNHKNSEYFRLYHSTRQGCPLSPLLFAKSHPELCGIIRNGVELKTAFYEDDLLLLVCNLSRSILAALLVLDEFSRISGYKLNLSKSEIFSVNKHVRKYPLTNLPFKVSHSGFVHLGVYVADTLDNLYRKNFHSLLAHIKQDFERWSLLNLSAAKINTVKMNIFPRFLYLFQCIPVCLPLSFFTKQILLFWNLFGIRRHTGCVVRFCRGPS